MIAITAQGPEPKIWSNCTLIQRSNSGSAASPWWAKMKLNTDAGKIGQSPAAAVGTAIW